MPKVIRTFVRCVDKVNRVLGRFTMYFVFVMMGTLLYSAIARSVFHVHISWVMEASQFLLSAYYLVGGAYSMQLDGHVRMDLFYSRWTPRTQGKVDCVTILFLIVFLGFLLWGGISSTEYALSNNQKNYTAWAPPLAPIKIIMTFGIFMMLMQAIATFFKDIARARGETLS